LPKEVLQGLARRYGALDVRERKLPCAVFFWAVVLVLSQNGPVWLSSVASEVSVACMLAGWEMRGRGLSKQAISDNMTSRPWGFFAAVFKYLWGCYALQAGGPLVGLETVRQLDVLLVDASILRVARQLAAHFPTYATPRSTDWAAVELHARLSVLRGLPEVVALTAVKADELSVEFLRQTGETVLYIFDLGYWCYALYDEIMDRQQHFLSRLKTGSNPLIKAVYVGEPSWLGKRLKEVELAGNHVDLLVNLTCAHATADTRRQPRQTLAQRRQVKGHLHTTYMEHDVRLVGHWQAAQQRWFLYVTSLLNPQAYPGDFIGDLYRVRWQIEIFFRNLKQVLGVRNFISHSENGIRIQLYAALLFYLLTQLVIAQAAQETGRNVEDFSMPYCLRVVRMVLTQASPSLLTGISSADAMRLERQLVDAVIAQGLRPNRHRPALLTAIRHNLPQAQAA